MYLITNRQLDRNNNGLKVFSDKPKTIGVHEITIVKVTKKDSAWVEKPVTGKLSP